MRLHPVTVVRDAVRYAAGAVFTVFVLASQGGSLGGFGSPAVLAGAALLLAGVAAFARYTAFEYELGEDTLVITSGVLSRQHREIPRHRIQTVDLNQSALERLVGVASVRIETAGGGQTEANLSVVGREEARRLKRELGRRRRRERAADDRATATAGDRDATGEEAVDGEPLDEAAEGTVYEDQESVAPEGQLVFELTGRELGALSAITVRRVAVLGLLFGVPFGSDVLRRVFRYFLGLTGVSVPDRIGGFATVEVVVAVTATLALVALVTWVVSALVTFVSYFGFKLHRLDGTLSYERGLLRRFEGSIPVEKIQTVSVTETVLMRRFGYAAVAVETAGYSPGGGSDGQSPSAVPLARRPRALALAERIEGFDIDLESVSFERPPRRLRRRYTVRYALAVVALTVAAFALSALVRPFPWYLPLAGVVLTPLAGHYHWKHLGFHVGDDHVVTRYGFWRRRTRVIPYYRLQTVIETRTVFQRRWGVATVTADTASSSNVFSGGAKVVDVETAVADSLHETLLERLRGSVVEHRHRRRRPGGGGAGGSGASGGSGSAGSSGMQEGSGASETAEGAGTSESSGTVDGVDGRNHSGPS